MSVEILHCAAGRGAKSVSVLIAAENRKEYRIRARSFLPVHTNDPALDEADLRRLYTAALTEALSKKYRSAALVIENGLSPRTAAEAYIALPDHDRMRLYLVLPASRNTSLYKKIAAFIGSIFTGSAELYESSIGEAAPVFDQMPAGGPSELSRSSSYGCLSPENSTGSSRKDNAPCAPPPEINAASLLGNSFSYTKARPVEKAPRALQAAPCPRSAGAKDTLAARLSRQEETFTQAMMRIIIQKGWTEAEVYNRIFMDRRLFSKIRSHANYQPKKTTAILLAFALRLNYDETLDFIGKAGYTLTHASKFDLIVEYFLQTGNYDVIELNETLYEFDQPSILKD